MINFGNSVKQLTQLVDSDLGDTSRKVSSFAMMFKQGIESGAYSPQLRRYAIAMLYISVLNEAEKKAAGQTHFNLETAINDLWTKLDGIRALDQRGDKNVLSGMPAATKELTEILGRVLEKK